MKSIAGLKEKNTAAVAEILSRLLADEFILYTKTRDAHWNVEGADFYSKHTFFENQYMILDSMIDEVAERIRMIGHYAPASLNTYLQLTHLTEIRGESNHSIGFIKDLLADHNSVIIFIRSVINRTAAEYEDNGSSDFITGLLEKHEKMAWILRAHLKE